MLSKSEVRQLARECDASQMIYWYDCAQAEWDAMKIAAAKYARADERYKTALLSMDNVHAIRYDRDKVLGGTPRDMADIVHDLNVKHTRRAEARIELESIIDSLSRMYDRDKPGDRNFRTVLRLRYIDRLTEAEVARRAHMTRRAVNYLLTSPTTIHCIARGGRL